MNYEMNDEFSSWNDGALGMTGVKSKCEKQNTTYNKKTENIFNVWILNTYQYPITSQKK